MGTIKKIIVLVLILAVPGFLYYLLTSQGKNRYKPLPFFGPKPLSGAFHTFHGKKIPDTLYHTVADFNLQNQDGKQVSFKTIGPKILVINLFHAHGSAANFAVMSAMDSLVKYYSKNNLVSFASVTVDPERDDKAALKDYMKEFRQPTSKWEFLTGDTSIIYPLARKGLLIDALKMGKNDFVYSYKLVLLDPEHRIRGYYDGTLSTDVARLADELKVQIAEELRKKDKPLY